MKTHKNKRRMGFTLVELLLVISILGILGTVVVVNFGGTGEDARIKATQTSIGQIGTAITVYEQKATRLPKTLDDLTVGFSDGSPALLKQAALKDAWGNAFEYKQEGRANYVLRSAGPDGTMNTEDDLTN